MNGSPSIDELRQILLQSLGVSLEDHDCVPPGQFHKVVAMDSVALLEFVVAIEQRFGIALEPEWLDMERLGNLPALAEYIRSRRTA